jgi:hypothetical protein
MFVGRYDSQGNLNWIKTGGNDEARGGCISYNPFSGLICIGGLLSGKASFNNGQASVSVPSSAKYYGFTALYDSYGNFYTANCTNGANSNDVHQILGIVAGAPYSAGFGWGYKNFYVLGSNYPGTDIFLSNTLQNNIGSGYYLSASPDKLNCFVAEYSMYPIVRGFTRKSGNSTDDTKYSDLKKGDFAVYPNPSSGDFSIQIASKESTVVRVNLSNIVGEVIYTETKNIIIGDNLLTENFNDFPGGIYLIKVITEKETLSKKIVIQK